MLTTSAYAYTSAYTKQNKTNQNLIKNKTIKQVLKKLRKDIQ